MPKYMSWDFTCGEDHCMYKKKKKLLAINKWLLITKESLKLLNMLSTAFGKV